MFVQTLFTKKTLNQDINEHLSEQNLQYMLNGDLYSTGTEGSQVFIQNQLSNELNLDINVSKLCGFVKLDKNQFVLFFEPEEIGLYDSDLKTYTKWASNICLNLSLNNWVTGVYKYIKEKRWIYFIDGVNPIRYLNIDEKYPGEYENCRTCNDVPDNVLDCNRIKLFKDFNIPRIKLTEIEGNLPGGNYQIAIRFTDNQIGISEYYIYSDNVKVHSNYDQRFGIKVDFECFNTDYEEYEIVLIANRADRATVGQSIGFFDVSVTSVTITELDSAKYHPVDSTNLLEIKPYYQSAKHIATNNESLILGSVKTRPVINYHPQAFKIKSKWVSLKVPAKNAHKFKSYMRDEVYAHNIRWIYKDGERTNWFHIKPQVTPPPSDLLINSKDTWDDCDNPKKYWEVYNTATVDSNNQVSTEFRKYRIKVYPSCIEYECNGQDFAFINPEIEYIDCDGVSRKKIFKLNEKFTASKIISCKSQRKNFLSDFFGDPDPVSGMYLNPYELAATPQYTNIQFNYTNTLGIRKIYTFRPDSNLGPDLFELCALKDSITPYLSSTKYQIINTSDCDTVIIDPTDCSLYSIQVKTGFTQVITLLKNPQDPVFPKDGICVKYTDASGNLTQQSLTDINKFFTIKYGTSYTFYENDNNKDCTNTILGSYTPLTTSYVNFEPVEGSYTDCTKGTTTSFKIAPNTSINVLPSPVIVCSKDNPVVSTNITNYEITSLGPCNVSGDDPFSGIKDCYDYEIYKTGNFAYWESTLTYPDLPEFGEYRCQKIQYHKFPDNQISPHFETKTNTFCSYSEYASILTIVFEDIEFPKDENGNFIPDIVGYEIGVTDRRGNKSIIHKGLLYNMMEEPLESCSQTGFYANYPFNDLTEDPFIGSKWTSNPTSSIIADGLSGVPHTGLKAYSKNMFSYISPNINFVRNDQGSELILYDEVIGTVNGQFTNTDEMPRFSLPSPFYYFISSSVLTLAIIAGVAGVLGSNPIQTSIESLRITLEMLKNSISYLQHAKNYLARANYVFRNENSSNVKKGNKRRRIDISQFLSPTKILLNNIKINNYQREASLFIKVSEEIDNTKTEDRTKFLFTDLNCSPTFNSCANKVNNKTIQAASYYAGIKNYMPSQYGDLYSANINQVTNILKTASSGIVFGGDVYVTKHKQVRKLPFFTDIPKDLNANEYFTLSDKANVGIPRFYADHIPENEFFKTLTSLGPVKLIGSIVGAASKDSNLPFHLDRSTSYQKRLCQDFFDNCMKKEFIMPYKGFGSDYGSSINNPIFNSTRYLLNVQGSFYTHVIGVVEYWCESEYIGNFREINNVPQSNIERPDSEIKKYDTILYPELFLYDLSFLAKNVSKVTPFHKVNSYSYNVLDDFKIPFSIKDDIESGLDNWRVFKPANYHQFTPADGSLTTIHSINDYNLMFSFENATYITQSDDGIITNQGASAFLGGGSIFQRRMKRISDEQTGFGGSVDKYSFCNSRFGTLWVDRLRKRIFLYDGQPRDITTGLETWLDKYLPEGKPDNYFDSVRCIFDNYTKNFYITFNNKVDKPWTVSFKPEIKSFISFHSFTPLVYFQLPNNFLSIGPEAKGIWKHNKLYSYQSYYDKFYKFDVGYVLTTRAFKKIALNNIEIGAQFFNELGFNKRQYKTDVFFNQFCVYNSHVTTGLKSIVFKDPAKGLKNVQSLDQSISEVTEVDSHIYRINGVRNYATPLYNGTLLVENTGPMDYALFNYDYNTSVTNQGKIQGKLLNVHFINTEHDMKILMHYGINNVEEVKQ